MRDYAGDCEEIIEAVSWLSVHNDDIPCIVEFFSLSYSLVRNDGAVRIALLHFSHTSL